MIRKRDFDMAAKLLIILDNLTDFFNKYFYGHNRIFRTLSWKLV